MQTLRFAVGIGPQMMNRKSAQLVREMLMRVITGEMTTRKLMTILICAFAATLLILLLTLYFAFCVTKSISTTSKGDIWVEIVKVLLQLLVVIIIGGLVTFLVKAAEQRRQELRVRADKRADYLNRLGRLYRSAKAARPCLRAGGLTSRFERPPHQMDEGQAHLYKTQMERVNEAQLDLEGLKIDAKSLPAFVEFQALPVELERMEDYLSKILTEFEENCPLFQKGESVTFDALERLDEFTGKVGRQFEFSHCSEKTRGYRFKEDFSGRYRAAVEIVSKGFKSVGSDATEAPSQDDD